jgi:glycosyltransferase involved in cell wall biosynthesis
MHCKLTERCDLMFKYRRKHAVAGPGTSAKRPVVALVSSAIFPYHLGGLESRYHELTKVLAGTTSIHIYTMQWWEGSRTLVDGDITLHAISKLHDMYVDGHRSTRQALLFAAGCVALFRERFDVLLVDQIPYVHILVLRVVATVKRKRLVVTWHEVWGKDYWREYLGRTGIFAWLVESIAMRLPDHILAASPETAQRLQSAIGAKASISVAEHGADLDAIRRTVPDSSDTDLVVVGRLIDHKRVDMLLEAMALLHAQGVPVSCRVIGDGPQRAALHRLADDLGLAEAVDFRHDVREQKDVYALVKAAKIAVFPSEREGFGAAVLEALACGIPVVTTSSPDNLSQFLARRASLGHVCAPTSAALAEMLQDLLSHPAQLSGNVDSWLEDYSWPAIANKYREACRIQ